jgi:hypothetical protein
MSDKNILARDVLAGVFNGIVVEDYPSYGKGPCVLVLQKDLNQEPNHVVWGIPKDLSSPAAVVTAYRPDPDLWSEDFTEEKSMRKKRHTKLVHEGQYVAEVEVELIETDEGWSPYLSLEDANKLDDVRAALRRGDLKSAARLSRVFSLTPVAV